MHSKAAAQVLNYWQAVDDPYQSVGSRRYTVDLFRARKKMGRKSNEIRLHTTCPHCGVSFDANRKELRAHLQDIHNIGGKFDLEGRRGRKVTSYTLCHGCGKKRPGGYEYKLPDRGRICLCQSCRDSRLGKRAKDALKGAYSGGSPGLGKRK